MMPLQRDRVELVEEHLPLVRALARRYARGVELDDLVGAGSLGLVKAAARFRPERGVAFGSFAAPTIAGEMQHYVRDCRGAVRLPRRDAEASRRVWRARQDLAARLRRSPTDAELAEASGVGRAVIDRASQAELAREPVSLSELHEFERTDGVAATELRAWLESSLRKLPHHERQVVRLRFFGDLSQSEIARRTGTSQTQVSRLLADALAHLREDLQYDGVPG